MSSIVAVVTNIRRVIKAFDDRLKPVCRQYDLTLIEARIIGFLDNNPAYDTPGSIAEFRLLSKSNVSTAVDNLLKRGLLTKTDDDIDRRKVHLQLSPAAIPIARAIGEIRIAFGEELFEGFSVKEKKEFIRLHEKISRNMQKKEKDDE